MFGIKAHLSCGMWFNIKRKINSLKSSTTATLPPPPHTELMILNKNSKNAFFLLNFEYQLKCVKNESKI